MSIGFVMGDPDAVLLDPRFAGQVIHQTLQDVLWGELDFLLLDFPPGSGEPGQTLLRTTHVDGVLIVTTPQDMSLMDASRSLQMFTQAGVPIVGLIEDIVREVNKGQGTTIVLVTHNVFQAKRLAHRAGLLLDGKIIEICDVQSFFESPADSRTAAFVRGEMVY